ncbi:tRNA ligase, partial [Lecanoromycetidae sp. Uapishka_2]
MASQANTPYAPQDSQEVSSLLKELEASTKKHGGGKKAMSCKKHTYEVDKSGGIQVDSWQFRDWDYKRRDLPTYARGLFTYRRKGGMPEIAARGYDKFFNVGEVHETNWENVVEQTQGPYELSVKENGCIIFISGLEGDHLLVCSKHSTGARDNVNLSHAVAGEKWVDKHLAAVGKTRTDLAKELRKRNVTAVAELCDDSFEEHVLEYEPKDAGLYLHGMNLNLPEFATYPGELVHQFADEWGMRKAQFLHKDDVDSMKVFLDKCAETGSYAGRDTEGFVIRCRRRGQGASGNYQDWFFKFKFEEPYLMYRQWRECTKAIISGKPPKYKKHKKITERYLLYARRQLAKDPSLSKAYNQNHGIIAMRNGFLEEQGLEGHDIIRQEEEDGDGDAPVTENVVLLPVASIGCGKTTVALALCKLFNWGHVQNDNITGKSNRPKQFTIQVCNALGAHPAMVADRNNHQRRERKQIIDDVLQIIPQARFVALHYIHDPKSDMLPAIREVTQDRIFARGDNHQTIQAGTKSRHEIIQIMEGFLSRFEPVNPHSDPDDGFDNIIALDVAASSRENLETVVSSLHSMYPRLVARVPSSAELDQAIEAALSDYKPDIKHDLSFNSKKKDKGDWRNGAASQQNGAAQPKAPKLEYFAVKLPTSQISSTLDKVFSNLPPEKARMYRHLQQSRRVQPSFHVTLIHNASIKQHPDLWSHLASLHAKVLSERSENPSTSGSDPPIGKCRVRLERVVWDDRVMCIVARLLDEGWETANAIAHVTVGTASSNIKPKESNDLLQKWLENGTETGINECEVAGHVELHGNVMAVMAAR